MRHHLTVALFSPFPEGHLRVVFAVSRPVRDREFHTTFFRPRYRVAFNHVGPRKQARVGRYIAMTCRVSRDLVIFDSNLPGVRSSRVSGVSTIHTPGLVSEVTASRAPTTEFKNLTIIEIRSLRRVNCTQLRIQDEVVPVDGQTRER